MTFVYDLQGRRIAKTTESFVSGVWTITLSNRFIYDGWNLLAEINATNNAVINSFVWGLDLSGSLQGAGGVGGLLAITATNAGTHFVGGDGNGNVTVLVNASNGAATANYEYDPFGNVLRATGPIALLNPFRFASKYVDHESTFHYYGRRYYDPTLGGWITRDPIDEDSESRLYNFVRNDPIQHFDVHGLFFRCKPCSSPCDDVTDDGRIGGVVCCGGKASVCVKTPGGVGRAKNKNAIKIIEACIILHENIHLPYIVCPNSNTPTWGGFGGGPAPTQGGECAAHTASLTCLQAGKARCGNDVACQKQVQIEINISQIEKDKACRNRQ